MEVVLNSILLISNKLLAIFRLIVEFFNLTPKVMQYPIISNNLSPEVVTLLLTVVVGIITLLVIYGVIIQLSKITLNFFIFLKWASMGILIFGVIYNTIIGWN